MTGTGRTPVPIRRRLVVAATVPVVVTVALVAIPLGALRVRAIGEAADDALEARAAGLAAGLQAAVGLGQPIDEALLDRRLLPGTRAEVRVGDDRVTGGADLGDVPVRRAESPDVGDVHVTLVADDRATVDEQRDALAVVVGLAVASVLIAAIATLAVARRVAQPIEALAQAARIAGEGTERVPIPRTGIAEIDQVAEAMDVTLDRLQARLVDERQLSDTVAHQLRNSLTALRLQVEVAGLGDIDDRQRQALDGIAAQVDRFDNTIRAMTAVSRGDEGGEAAPIGELVAERIEFWRPSVERAGRAVEVSVTPGVEGVAADAATVRQALDVLVDNALQHGAGTIAVKVEVRSGHPVVSVEDDGPGVPEGMERTVFDRGVSGGGGTGIGLALARDLAASNGGRLELTSRRPPRFELWLPASMTRRDVAWSTPSTT